MDGFIRRLGSVVTGVLNGFDRLRFRGTKRLLASVKGMMSYLWQMDILLKNFKEHSLAVTEQVRQAAEQVSRASGRPLVYLNSPSIIKEDRAREIARRDGITQGLICILSSVEPCWSYDIHRNRQTRHIELQGGIRKCLHYYHYFLHPTLGFMHARLQTWFPFTMHLCVNGREWLARQMDREGLGYVRKDNCFVAVEDIARAQSLFDRQLRTSWAPMLNKIARQVNPADQDLFARCPVEYYWSAEETEWASDILFRNARELARIYPGLLHYGMTAFGSKEVMRFLGRRTPAQGSIHGNFAGEVVSDLQQRPEGIRIKHRLNRNSIKMYDKQGSVLRVETTINDARDMKVYRPKEGDEDGQKSWRYMRKGVADLHRRAQVSQAANERYLEAMATAEDKTPLREWTDPLCRPVKWKGKQVRALNPLSSEDAALLSAVNRGEFTLHGFRNRDLRKVLYGDKESPAAEVRRQSAAVTRRIRMLRAHGLIRKLPHTHRYQVSTRGRQSITALLMAREADTSKLIHAA
jgi:hypothetical protein